MTGRAKLVFLSPQFSIACRQPGTCLPPPPLSPAPFLAVFSASALAVRPNLGFSFLPPSGEIAQGGLFFPRQGHPFFPLMPPCTTFPSKILWLFPQHFVIGAFSPTIPLGRRGTPRPVAHYFPSPFSLYPLVFSSSLFVKSTVSFFAN